jgi:ADP-ribose pyrophosphatase
LLVASRYPNHARPLWNLPGGRQEPGELLDETVRREFREETSLEVSVDRLAYVSESYDPRTSTHYTNVAFEVSGAGEPRTPPDDAHAVECAWFAIEDLAKKLAVRVVREPLTSYLSGDARRYFGYADAGVTVEFFD